MKRHALFLVLLCFLALFFAVGTVNALTIPASEDSYSYRNTMSYGNASPGLIVDPSRQAFVYFDLGEIPNASWIKFARLRIFFSSVRFAGEGFTIHKVTGTWDESKSGTCPTFDPTPVATVDAGKFGAKRFVSVDITSTVRGWLSSGSNEGLAIVSSPSKTSKPAASFIIPAKEGAALGLPVQLEVEFDPMSSASGESLAVTGPRGEKGETGPVGPKGEKGDTGATGPAGPQGVWSGASVAVGTLSAELQTLLSRVSASAVDRFPPLPGFQLIPAGTFQMMTPAFGTSQLPYFNLNVEAFYSADTELTFGEWNQVKVWAQARGYDFDNPGTGQGDNYPVQAVSWMDSVKWCNAKSEKDGLSPVYFTDTTRSVVYRSGQVNLTKDCVDWTSDGYRLPTEAEWEKAARGGLVAKRFPWGDTTTHADANYFAQPSEFHIGPTRHHPIFNGQVSPVKYFPANGYGLYDVFGNVWEWCWAWEAGDPISSSVATGSAAVGLAAVARGMSYALNNNSPSIFVRPTAPLDSADPSAGFRVVRSAMNLAGTAGARGPKGDTGATGPQGIQGVAGMDGKTVLSGTIPPSSSLGTIGDFYINTATPSIYGPKTALGWGTGTSLVGPQGAQGIQGLKGDTGTTGPQGIQGPIGPQGPLDLTLSNEIRILRQSLALMNQKLMLSQTSNSIWQKTLINDVSDSCVSWIINESGISCTNCTITSIPSGCDDTRTANLNYYNSQTAINEGVWPMSRDGDSKNCKTGIFGPGSNTGGIFPSNPLIFIDVDNLYSPAVSVKFARLSGGTYTSDLKGSNTSFYGGTLKFVYEDDTSSFASPSGPTGNSASIADPPGNVGSWLFCTALNPQPAKRIKRVEGSVFFESAGFYYPGSQGKYASDLKIAIAQKVQIGATLNFQGIAFSNKTFSALLNGIRQSGDVINYSISSPNYKLENLESGVEYIWPYAETPTFAEVTVNPAPVAVNSQSFPTTRLKAFAVFFK